MQRANVILVCEDDAPIRQIVVHKLRSAGFEVFEARNGQEGLDFIGQGLRPDLILSDFQMPLVSGLEMCARLREGACAAVPVILLTARGYILSPDDLSRTNIRCVIPKPFGVKQLLERVRTLLAEQTDKRLAA
jgi:two-component system phosphate regulon response regulator PhoB